MENAWIYRLDTWLVAAVLFQLMLLLAFAGHQAALPGRRMAGKRREGSDPAVAATLGLLVLLLAVTFAKVIDAPDDRQRLVAGEAEAIQTALRWVALYPEEEREAFREDFKNYVEARIAYGAAGASLSRAGDALETSRTNGQRIWARTIRLASDSAYGVASDQMVPAVNEMLNRAAARQAGEGQRLPAAVVYLLLSLSLVAALVTGYAAGVRGRLHWPVLAGFCLLVAGLLFVTLDLDQPRGSLLLPKPASPTLLDLRILLAEPM
jgi:protein-S-isoprenylcysteine O-methyltransferase Ste14